MAKASKYQTDPAFRERALARAAKLYCDPSFRASKLAYEKSRRDSSEFLEDRRAYRLEYDDANREQLATNARTYQQKHALRICLRRKGLTLDDYDRVLADQGYTCAICHGPPDGRWLKYNIDHCHKTGKLRGLLCYRCNTSIGKFNDDPELLRAAATYLEKHAASTSAAIPDPVHENEPSTARCEDCGCWAGRHVVGYTTKETTCAS